MVKLFEEYISSLNLNGGVSLICESKSKDSKNGTKEDGKCNIIFVTKNPKSLTFTEGEVHKIRESAKKYGVDFYACDVDKITYKMNDDGTLTINKLGTFNNNNTLFIIRHASLRTQPTEEREKTKANLRTFFDLIKSHNFYISNDIDVVNDCVNKYSTFKKLKDNNVATIETVIIKKDEFLQKQLDNIDNMTKFLNEHDLHLPLGVKIIDGSQGIGVFKCDDMNILTSIIQYLVRKERDNGCIIQPFCDIDSDIRLHVFCKTLDPSTAKIDDYEIVGCMKREKADGDFRTNYSIGGKISSYKPSQTESRLAKVAAKAIGAVWCGVDVCHDKITNKDYVIEINASPSLKGISTVSKELPSDLIVKHFKKKKLCKFILSRMC